MATDSTALRVVTPMDEDDAAGALAHVLGTGDLYQLSDAQRVAHYLNLCRSCGLNPLSRPYQWIEFRDGDNPPVLTLYFTPTAAAQALRNNHISVSFPRREIAGELFVCEAHGTAPDGREGVGTQYVPLTGKYGRLTGRYLANALMSAETGALRRLALNMGVASGSDPDEGQIVKTVYVDGTGAILEQPTEEQRHLAEHPAVAAAIGEPTFETTVPELPDDDFPNQRPRPEEYDPPKPPRRPASFRHTEADVKKLLGAWFAAVKESSLDDDHERHAFVRAYTASMEPSWPQAKQTDSLKTFFARATAAEAGDLLAHARALVDDEQRANAEALAEHHGGQPPADEDDRAEAF
jgi:hypothetical protein